MAKIEATAIHDQDGTLVGIIAPVPGPAPDPQGRELTRWHPHIIIETPGLADEHLAHLAADIALLVRAYLRENAGIDVA